MWTLKQRIILKTGPTPIISVLFLTRVISYGNLMYLYLISAENSIIQSSDARNISTRYWMPELRCHVAQPVSDEARCYIIELWQTAADHIVIRWNRRTHCRRL